MKTYWFTIATGKTYQNYFNDLQRSASKWDIHIVNLGDQNQSNLDFGYNEQKAIKHLKIEGILGAPDTYEKIAYIDADTLIKDLDGINDVNGALKEPWGMGSVPLVAKEGNFINRMLRRKRLWKTLKKNNLEIFCPEGKYYRQEWNSGVIIGKRIFMEELAVAWIKWWDIVLDINDGIFRRDQMSFKYAYKNIAIDKYNYETIPPAYNWILKRMGYAADAKIYHRAGISNQPELNAMWEKARREILTGG